VSPPDRWRVYLLECSDGSYYTGIAKDVEARLADHNAGKGAKYTRGRTPARLLAKSGAMERGDALRAELRIKRLDRAEKPAAVKRAARKPRPAP
jgi:putative endonuclease